nr:immunoglobulin heavy chain junction region [Macaca mulatta]
CIRELWTGFYIPYYYGLDSW